MPNFRFPPPWSIEEGTESFTVKDANGHALTEAAATMIRYLRTI
jgi:hypothetical protein